MLLTRIAIDAKVVAQKFGVVTSSIDEATGIMGVGPGIDLTGSPFIIDTLASQGITKSRAFSLDLRSVDSPDGKMLPLSTQLLLIHQDQSFSVALIQ